MVRRAGTPVDSSPRIRFSRLRDPASSEDSSVREVSSIFSDLRLLAGRALGGNGSILPSAELERQIIPPAAAASSSSLPSSGEGGFRLRRRSFPSSNSRTSFAPKDIFFSRGAAIHTSFISSSLSSSSLSSSSLSLSAASSASNLRISSSKSTFVSDFAFDASFSSIASRLFRRIRLAIGSATPPSSSSSLITEDSSFSPSLELSESEDDDDDDDDDATTNR
mmetsp:Transcript_22101/g.41760  ORF Transcript_22101/g.41760 Transcript_22101/m.41760 type:complete len:222 (-) Transcript_22101:407-1072(-)